MAFFWLVFWLFNLAFFLQFAFLFYYYFLLFCAVLSPLFSLSPLFFSFIMLCCQPRRQSKCLSTLRDLAIVMVESCRCCCLGSRSGLVKLLAAHPFNCPSVRPPLYLFRPFVCQFVWRKLKLTKICYILPAHKVQLPPALVQGAGAVEHSLLRNSAPATPSSPTPSSPTSSASAWFFLFLFSAALFVLFYCCCCCCWSLLQFICMLKYVAFSLSSFFLAVL